MAWYEQGAYTENPIIEEDVERFVKPEELMHIERLMAQLEEAHEQLSRAELTPVNAQDVKVARRRDRKADMRFKMGVQSVQERIRQRRRVYEWQQAQLRTTKEWEDARKIERQIAKFEAMETRLELEENAPVLRMEQVFQENLRMLRQLCDTEDDYEHLQAILFRGEHPQKLAEISERNRHVIERHWGIGSHRNWLTPFSQMGGDPKTNKELYDAGIRQLLYYRTDEPRHWPDLFVDLPGTGKHQMRCLVCREIVFQDEYAQHLHTETQVDRHWTAEVALEKGNNSAAATHGLSPTSDVKRLSGQGKVSDPQYTERRKVQDNLGYADRGDATWGLGQMYRDHGQYGSLPVQDGYGDEDMP